MRDFNPLEQFLRPVRKLLVKAKVCLSFLHP